MEIVGIGSDIVECLRIGRMIERHGELFLLRVFTEREVQYCQHRRRATEHFAAHWAAKEAILASLGTAWWRGLSWTDVEVRPDEGNYPRVVLAGSVRELAARLNVADVLLTLAHCRAYATAYAIAIRGSGVPPVQT
jgi:holo-[acyl-carrier protein] synthase